VRATGTDSKCGTAGAKSNCGEIQTHLRIGIANIILIFISKFSGTTISPALHR
jgi:hypothetical protein